jgi:hypothetical protein
MPDRNNSPPMTPSLNANPDEIFLTEKQLAARERRTSKTLRNDRVKGNYIPFLKIGGSIRYSLTVVLAYEAKHRVSCSGRPTACGDLRNDTFLTPTELAIRHQRALKTLTNDRAKRLYISFYKFEGQIRYALSDVLAYERAQGMTATKPKDRRKSDGANDSPNLD